MTGIVNCECSDGDGHGIAPNLQIQAILPNDNYNKNNNL